ncbi:MAG: T9SS type A sorting domain-containing protein [Flavobacterium sp.]|uniref:T9SS type A sorting domain-containing protein n=1 Tax=Flavobacterium sp. TaxID=239 RepID=UPI002605C9A0|nr:T9SS type A sorting domain-containing protein [Flavobacterium sp.]MDD5152009.1 T9SS type A sorting domain-containing protein [Flavobacterium sp.]
MPNQTTQTITIYNRGTSNLTAATVNYSINGGANIAYNWTGNLATNKYDTFTILINSPSNGTISASIASANGGTDQRTTNNTASGNFVIPSAAPNHTFTTYNFRLQQDLWGSETTWEIKNGSGVILYSGGPYTDKSTLPLPSLISQTWTLPANQCYTFTINDSAGDGICCGASGDGYYDIKSTDGLTVVTSGSSFTSSQSFTFTTNTLGNIAFETSNEIYLYPNPTRGTLNIRIPYQFGLPNSYVIYNSLGQTISQKEVSIEPDLTINTSTLSNGIYFISVIKDTAKKILQFIKE